MEYTGNCISGNVFLTEEQQEELMVQTTTYQNLAVYYHEGELGSKAVEAWKYYYGELPIAISENSSSWTDRTVWESVNGTLQELISVFTSGENAVRFTPRHSKDAVGAEAATQLVNKALLVDNDGYRVLHDVFKESCVVRNSWVKRYWKEGYEIFNESFSDLTEEEVALYLQNIEEEDLISLNLTQDVDSNLSKGDISYKRFFEKVVVEYVPFEQVIIEPTATSILDTNYLGHRVRKHKEELIEMGFNEEVVENLGLNTVSLTESVITMERMDDLLPLNPSDNVSVGDDRTDKVWLYENYIRTSIPTGEMELLQVFTVNQQILEINRVSEIPFENVCPLPIPGGVFGESIVDITKEIQDLNSFLTRGILENIINANNQRYMALENAVDYRDLMDNRPNGIVRVKTPNAVTPFPYHPLPQGMMNLLEYTEQKKEARTGVTKLGQGLDPNVFKNDNAFATVNTMMTASQNRLRMIARNIAEGSMKDLMLSIYKLIRENGTQPIIVETSAGPQEIIPKQMPKRDQMIVAVAVGASERKERAQTLTGLLQIIQQSPQLAGFVQQQNAYYLGTQMFEAMGIYDIQNYLTPPEKIPPPQPNPADEMQLQTMAENIKNLQAQTQKLLSDITESQQKLQFEQYKTADEFSMKKEESLSKQDEAADKMSIEERKLMIAERELILKEKELELKRQELVIEASLENRQGRAVGLG